MEKDLKLILAFYELSKKYAREIASGGGSGVLVAHTNIVEGEAITPNVPFPVTLDKTYAELAAEESSAIAFLFGVNGVVMGTYVIPLVGNISFEGGQLLYHADLMMGQSITAIVLPNGTATITMNSEEASSNVLIAHATVAALPEPGDEPLAIALDKTIAELAAAEACAVEIAFSEDGVDATVTLDRNFSMAGDGNVQLGFATGAAVVELIGEQLMVSAQALGGEEAVMLMAFPDSSGDEPLVLHGTLTSQTEGTVTESISDLLAAAQAKRRIMLEFSVDSDTINLEMGFRYFYTENGETHINVDGFFRYSVGSTPCLVKVLVFPSGASLAMSAEYFALTPLSGS